MQKKTQTTLEPVEFQSGLRVYFLFYHDGYKRLLDDRFAGGESYYKHEEDVQKRVLDYEDRGYKTKVLSGIL